jgi:hypothetical protein
MNAREAVIILNGPRAAVPYGEAISVARAALVGLIDIYDAHDLGGLNWEYDFSPPTSGADDAAALYALLRNLGLEVK